ncbi:MAG: hypothetical protein ABIG95_02900 [Candidatus Woesearchaeota archaeon]
MVSAQKIEMELMLEQLGAVDRPTLCRLRVLAYQPRGMVSGGGQTGQSREFASLNRELVAAP